MRYIRLRRGTARRLFAYSASLVFLLLSTHAVFGQIATRKGREPDSGISYPRLPGAVTKAPEGLNTDAPFDIKKSFTILSPSQNAAPLYLDALFEFGANLDICFQPGPATDRRRQATTDRNKRYSEIAELFYKDPKAVSASTMDDVIKLYDTGFRKLAEAQRRERCVFETGLWTTTLLPHVQVARQVARVSQLTLMIPGVPSFIRSESRGAAVLRASECLIAVRHWQLRHRGNPPEMATAIQGSSLKAVPIDPYDGKPMRLTQIDG
jgi:hypothetical protein